MQSCLTEFMKNKIISNHQDLIGVLLYNTFLSENPLGFANMTVWLPLDRPSAQAIKTSQSLFRDFSSQIGSSDKPAAMHEVLWLCSHILKQGKENESYQKRVFLFTHQDNPVMTSEHRRQAIHQARQLQELDTEIELFPLPTPEQVFDVRTFYAELIAFDSDDVNAGMLDVSQKIQDLSRRLRAKEFKKRRLGRITMKIQDMQVGVGCYSLVNKAKVPYGRKLEGKDNKPVSSTGHYRSEGCKETLFSNQIGTCVKLGGEKIPLTTEEMKTLKTQVIDGASEGGVMNVIGFRDRTKLKAYHSIKTSYFIAADDERITNSSSVLDALIVTLVKKG